MLEAWTIERTLALAPDSASAKAGTGLASLSKWGSLGHNEQALWGLCQGSGKNPYQTQVDLREIAFRCSCPSRKFPCKHSIGLMLLYVSQSDAFKMTAAPQWVTQWLQDRADKAQRSREKQAAAIDDSPEAVERREAGQARRSASREQKVAGGMAELRLWLMDLVRRGLAAAGQEPSSFWTGMAARLVDAQAAGAARLVGEMGECANSGAQWQERMLALAGRLYLLTEGYANLASQPPEQQAEIRSLLGWTQAAEELASRPAEIDEWTVLAQTVETQERLRVQRTWLWGAAIARPALVLNFAHGTAGLDVSLSPGTVIDASVVYYDAAWPLRAIVREGARAKGALVSMPGYPTIEAAVDAYAAALSISPFIEQFPMPLTGASLTRQGDGWQVQDGGGAVLPVRACRAWPAVSLGGGRPIGIFGLWDGRQLCLQSVVGQGRFLQMAT